MTKLIYVDMDGVLCDYKGAWDRAKSLDPTLTWPQSVPGFFAGLEPLPGAIESFNILRNMEGIRLHILTAASVYNPPSYAEKRIWVEQHLGFDMCDHFTITPDKSLWLGDFLIDDHDGGRGQERFGGELIHFGSVKWPDWATVLAWFRAGAVST
jgi:5'-nucleotidase